MISVLSNVMPAAVHDMVMEFLNGNIKSALDIQLKYLDLIEALFCEVNPIPVKAAMKLLGYDVGDFVCRSRSLRMQTGQGLKKAWKT